MASFCAHTAELRPRDIRQLGEAHTDVDVVPGRGHDDATRPGDDSGVAVNAHPAFLVGKRLVLRFGCAVRTAVQVRDFYIFDVVARCRETVSDTELVYDIAHFASRAILLSLAHSCEKNYEHTACAPLPGQDGRIRLPPDLPVVDN
jgi:hypothetical protein